MKVIIGNDTYPPDVNGAAYFTRRLAVALSDRGHEVHVLCPSRSLWSGVMTRDGVVECRTRSLPVPFHPGFRFCPPPFLLRHVLEEVRRIRPDVVHAQGHFLIGRALIRAAKQLGVPVVATNHFMPDNLVFYLHLPERIEKKVAEWAWHDFSRVFDRADLVTAPTPFAAKLAEENGLNRSILPISCGMDLSRFSPTNGGHAFKTRYGVPERPVFMYVGRLDAEKHVDELIEALPLVRKSVDAQLVLVGEGHEQGNLVSLASGQGVEGYVTFTGFVPDGELPGAYAAADVFCNASTAELQSIVTMEAMATGKPVVAANARALPLLVHDGENGRLFEPGDVEGLASRLAELLSDEGKRTRMGRESLRIVARHDIGITLDAFEELYEALSVPGSGVTVPSLPSEPSPPVAERARRAERAAPYEPN
jgi:glycosyltransferase involved in cell wall biosynthesis